MKKKRFLVIGLGRFGTALATALFDAEQDVMVLDRDEDAIDRVKKRTTAAYVGDARNAETLESVNAGEMDVVVVTFSNTFESTVLATSTLAKLGTKQIVARVSSERQAEVLAAVGAHRTLHLEADMGRRLASEMMTPANEALLELAKGYQVVPWRAQGDVVGKSITDSGLYARHHLIVIGFAEREDVDRRDIPRIRFPRPDYVIQEGDSLLLVGEDKNVATFLEHQPE